MAEKIYFSLFSLFITNFQISSELMFDVSGKSKREAKNAVKYLILGTFDIKTDMRLKGYFSLNPESLFITFKMFKREEEEWRDFC